MVKFVLREYKFFVVGGQLLFSILAVVVYFEFEK